jgi:CRP-like cAMP-binding protein
MTSLTFEEIYSKLLKLQIFQYFKEDDPEDKRILEEAFQLLTVKNFKAKDFIITEGEEADTFFILVKGSVQITRKTFSGDKLALANLDDTMGVSFGENSLIGKSARSASIQALTDCKTLVLTGGNFRQFSKREPSFGYKVLLSLAQQMSRTINKTNNDVSTLYEALYNEIEEDN